MIKLMFCLRRRSDLTREEFSAYWAGPHGRLGTSLAADLGYLRYVQSHTLTSELNDALQAGRKAPSAFDGVVELWFENEEAVSRTFSGKVGRAAARALLNDEHNFVDIESSPIFLVHENQLWPQAGNDSGPSS